VRNRKYLVVCLKNSVAAGNNQIGVSYKAKNNTFDGQVEIAQRLADDSGLGSNSQLLTA